MKTEIRRLRGRPIKPSIIPLSGSWDLKRAPELRDLLAGQDWSRPVILDFSQTEFVDTVILGIVAGAQRTLKKNGIAPMRIRFGDALNVRRLFAVTGLDSLFEAA